MSLTWFNNGVTEAYRILAPPAAQAEAIDRCKARSIDSPEPGLVEEDVPALLPSDIVEKTRDDERQPGQFEQLQRRLHQGARPVPGGRERAVYVNQIMTSPVIVVKASDSLETALRLLQTNQIRHLPVVDDANTLTGIISDRDLLRYSPPPAAIVSQPLRPLTVAGIMSGRLLTCRVDTEIREAADVLVKERINCLPVIDPVNRVVGIVTTTDILRCLVERAPLDLWV